ncbi:inorganic diphosphatase [Pectobacterium cacticida]|uniref:inorganic diphosphatase n=1 Tax=Pectobacterium cacticida TaxID=69221 RepID=UPI002FF0B2E3
MMNQQIEALCATARIEIPAGSIIRYDVTDSGEIKVKYFQAMPVCYPGNYGSLIGTLAEDCDPLDVLVLTREPLFPGSLIDVRVIGYLAMLDGGVQDDKVIAVPTHAVDPLYSHIFDISHLAPAELQLIEAFYHSYKQLPAGRKSVVLNGFHPAIDAQQLLEKARASSHRAIRPPLM